MKRLNTGGFDDQTLDAIVNAVVGRVRDRLTVNYQPAAELPVTPPARTLAAPQGGGEHVGAPFVAPKQAAAPSIIVRGDDPGVHEDLDTAVASARRAFEEYERMPLQKRFEVVAAMRQTALAHLDEMCERAVRETGLGRVEDKRIKNRVAITKTPGPEFLEPIAQSGDDGLMLLERAPFGVICSITPCTNPTETIINNGIGMVAGGNAVLFNVHPTAKQTSAWYVALLNRAIAGAGGPATLLNCIREPSVETAQKACWHEGVRIVVVTGGGAGGQEAMRSASARFPPARQSARRRR
ncbi:MAG: aldehyde dehydrogenase family protein [Polyangiales bacterium]